MTRGNLRRKQKLILAFYYSYYSNQQRVVRLTVTDILKALSSLNTDLTYRLLRYFPLCLFRLPPLLPLLLFPLLSSQLLPFLLLLIPLLLCQVYCIFFKIVHLTPSLLYVRVAMSSSS